MIQNALDFPPIFRPIALGMLCMVQVWGAAQANPATNPEIQPISFDAHQHPDAVWVRDFFQTARALCKQKTVSTTQRQRFESKFLKAKDPLPTLKILLFLYHEHRSHPQGKDRLDKAMRIALARVQYHTNTAALQQFSDALTPVFFKLQVLPLAILQTPPELGFFLMKTAMEWMMSPEALSFEGWNVLSADRQSGPGVQTAVLTLPSLKDDAHPRFDDAARVAYLEKVFGAKGLAMAETVLNQWMLNLRDQGRIHPARDFGDFKTLLRVVRDNAPRFRRVLASFETLIQESVDRQKDSPQF